MYCTCHACYASCMLVHVFSGACGVCMCIWYMWCMYICTGHVYLVVYVCVCGWCMIVYVFGGACHVCMCISYMYGTCIYWTCVFSCVCMCILWMYGACCACIHVYVVHICNCKCKIVKFTQHILQTVTNIVLYIHYGKLQTNYLQTSRHHSNSLKILISNN